MAACAFIVLFYLSYKGWDFIRDVRFKNVAVTGRPGVYGVKLAGADSEHDVREVTFENLSILGASLTRNAALASIGPHVGEVRFAGPAAGGSVK